jgi:hypothetical protein
MNQASRSTPWKILMRTFVQERESQANDVNSSFMIMNKNANYPKGKETIISSKETTIKPI